MLLMIHVRSWMRRDERFMLQQSDIQKTISCKRGEEAEHGMNMGEDRKCEDLSRLITNDLLVSETIHFGPRGSSRWIQMGY